MINLTTKPTCYQVIQVSQYSHLNDTLKFDSLKAALGYIDRLRSAALSIKGKTAKLQFKGDDFIFYCDSGTILEVKLQKL